MYYITKLCCSIFGAYDLQLTGSRPEIHQNTQKAREVGGEYIKHDNNFGDEQDAGVV